MKCFDVEVEIGNLDEKVDVGIEGEGSSDDVLGLDVLFDCVFELWVGLKRIDINSKYGLDILFV